MHIHKYRGAFKGKMTPQIELHFTTSKQAQMAVALLKNAQLNNSKIARIHLSYEDRGRRVILDFEASSAQPSEIVASVLNIVDTMSAAHPLTREVLIPFSAETRSNI